MGGGTLKREELAARTLVAEGWRVGCGGLRQSRTTGLIGESFLQDLELEAGMTGSEPAKSAADDHGVLMPAAFVQA
jgi:hypothetical protein